MSLVEKNQSPLLLMKPVMMGIKISPGSLNGIDSQLDGP